MRRDQLPARATAKMPDAIIDVKLALAWIREHIAEYGGDPNRIVVSGGSAGGHLAAMAALTVNEPEYQPGFESADTSVLACVPLYPPTDLLALFDDGGPWTRRMIARTTPWVFGVAPAVDPERYRHWSPVTLVRPGLVPFLVVQGTGDNLVPYRQTRAFVDRLRAQPGQEVVYVELPGAPHAFEVFHSLRAEAAASRGASVLFVGRREPDGPRSSPRVQPLLRIVDRRRPTTESTPRHVERPVRRPRRVRRGGERGQLEQHAVVVDAPARVVAPRRSRSVRTGTPAPPSRS